MTLDQSTRELITGALDETRALVAALPEELFHLRRCKRAADAFAESYQRSADSEETQGKWRAYQQVRSEG